MGRGDSNGVSIREALVLWAVLILVLLRWSKPVDSEVQRRFEPHQAASTALPAANTR
jgi:hypothetical protein